MEMNRRIGSHSAGGVIDTPVLVFFSEGSVPLLLVGQRQAVPGTRWCWNPFRWECGATRRGGETDDSRERWGAWELLRIVSRKVPKQEISRKSHDTGQTKIKQLVPGESLHLKCRERKQLQAWNVTASRMVVDFSLCITRLHILPTLNAKLPLLSQRHLFCSFWMSMMSVERGEMLQWFWGLCFSKSSLKSERCALSL